MSYSYLLDLYRVIDHRLDRIQENPAHTGESPTEVHHDRGRHDCLTAFRHYLKDHYQHQLPRRIQQSLKEQP